MRKHLLIVLLLFVGTSGLLAQVPIPIPSSNVNHIVETTAKVAGIKAYGVLMAAPIDSVNRKISYFDGLGRPVQTIDWLAGPSKNDIVQVFEYDGSGREQRKYLPYADYGSLNNSYKYKTAAGAAVTGYYADPQYGPDVVRTASPFSLSVFESSPLGRTVEQGAPGADFQPVKGSTAGHTAKMRYGTNAANEVRLWQLSGSGATGTGHYAAGRLYKTVSMDENWTSGKGGTAAEFKDMDGRVVLKRQWLSDTDSLSTYYVYDDIGSLRYVVPPAVTATSFAESDAEFKQYIYGYHYDNRKRLVEKKIPGKGWEYLVYNRLDQVCFTQDSVQRASGTWGWTKYDAQGRTVITGIETGLSATRAYLQGFLDGQPATAQWEGRTSATPEGYTYNAPPQGSMGSPVLEFQAINYYDDYDFPGYGSSYYPSILYSSKTKGLLTGTKTLVLGTSTYLLTVMHYDDEGRLAETVSDNCLGGTDRTTNTYSFTGELMATLRTHIANGTTTTIANTYAYDHAGRKLSTKENINSQGDVWLNKLEYNGIGQLLTKSLHGTSDSTFMQATTSRYNERGWLKGNISNEFSFWLDYQENGSGQYNGNISRQYWSAGSSPLGSANVFSYGYDRLDRLTSGTSTGIVMGEEISYDKMGNIATMERYDGTVNRTGTYNYTGHQLDDIRGGTLATKAYAYDGNGNATTDGRLRATVAYNQLNLPISFTKSGDTAISLSYVYDATGRKLQRINALTADTTSYIDGIQYTNHHLDFIQTGEGRALNNGGSYSYEYDLRDHLGNVRYSFDIYGGAVRKLQEDDYYPFGIRRHVTLNGVGNNYLYNGKELQDELGQYDYGARFYDPVIGRFNVVDALAEHPEQINASPYVYTGNNPISRIDPDGNCWPCLIWEGIAALTTTEAVVVTAGAATATYLVVKGVQNYNRDRNYSVQDNTSTNSAYNKYNDPNRAVDYSKKNSSDSQKTTDNREGKDFTRKGKKEVIEKNKAKNDGETKCENCGIPTTKPEQSKKGVTPPKTDTQVDHIEPKAKNGKGTPDNGQVLCRDCNIKKSDKMPTKQ